MSDDVADRLRALAKDYSRGYLAFEAYRQRRRALLDSLVPGSEGQALSREPSLQEGFGQQAPSRGPSLQQRLAQRALSQQWSPRAASRARALVLLLCAALAVGAIGISLYRDGPGGDSPTSEPRPSTSVDSDRIYRVVAPLLNDPDWTEARVAAVNASLLEEGPRRLAAARNADWFQHFTAQVRQHLLARQEESADSRAPAEQSSLAALAVTLGLDLPAPPQSNASSVHRL